MFHLKMRMYEELDNDEKFQEILHLMPSSARAQVSSCCESVPQGCDQGKDSVHLPLFGLYFWAERDCKWIGHMESCTCRRCRCCGGTPPPPPPSFAWHENVMIFLGRSAFTLSKRTCLPRIGYFGSLLQFEVGEECLSPLVLTNRICLDESAATSLLQHHLVSHLDLEMFLLQFFRLISRDSNISTSNDIFEESFSSRFRHLSGNTTLTPISADTTRSRSPFAFEELRPKTVNSSSALKDLANATENTFIYEVPENIRQRGTQRQPRGFGRMLSCPETVVIKPTAQISGKSGRFVRLNSNVASTTVDLTDTSWNVLQKCPYNKKITKFQAKFLIFGLRFLQVPCDDNSWGRTSCRSEKKGIGCWSGNASKETQRNKIGQWQFCGIIFKIIYRYMSSQSFENLLEERFREQRESFVSLRQTARAAAARGFLSRFITSPHQVFWPSQRGVLQGNKFTTGCQKFHRKTMLVNWFLPQNSQANDSLAIFAAKWKKGAYRRRGCTATLSFCDHRDHGSRIQPACAGQCTGLGRAAFFGRARRSRDGLMESRLR